MDDLISRKSAIDALEREQSLKERPITEIRWFDLGLRKAQEVLSELPSAQPERKRGKWEWNNGDELYYSCSCCGHKAYGNSLEIIGGAYHFCPNCGAMMKGADDGTR